MKVREIMSSPVSVNPSATVAETARMMLDTGAAGLPVVDDRGAVLGMVRRIDLVSKHATVHAPVYLGILGSFIPFRTDRTEEDLKHALAVRAADLMSPAATPITPEMDVDDAARAMEDERADPLLVVEDGNLVGVLSQADVIRLLIVEESGEVDGDG